MKRRLLFLVVPTLTLLVMAGPARASCDPGFERQWGLTQVNASTGWSRSTGAGVKIGIVDTGIDLKHEDLASKVVAGTKCDGTNGSQSQCTGKKADAQDDHGHGTHVAGIAAAYKDNGIGVAGVAPDAQLVIAKVLYNDGQGGASGTINDINAGIKWVVDNGARVVNLSVGSDGSVVTGIFGDSSLESGIEYAWQRGAVVALASGNQNLFGFGSSNYGSSNAIVVGATGPQNETADYSSPLGNAKYTVMAPGGNASSCASAKEKCVFSTFWQPGSTGNLYGYLQGTSMATPFVTGAAADLLSQGLNPTQARDRIINAISPMSCGGSCKGRLNLAAALGATTVAPSSCPGSTPTTKPTSSGGGSSATTRTTKKANGTATTAGSGGTVTSTPGTSIDTTSSSVVDGSTSTTVQGDNLQVAQAPVGNGGSNDSGASGPLKVAATLGILGAGGTAAPFVWRRFRFPR